MAFPSISAFAAGAGLLALWIDTRFPGLAPASFSRRVFAACAAIVLLRAAPLAGTSAAAAYATLFAVVLPAFVMTFLTAVWLLRALRDAQASA
jgi:hypothetical protein